jgi:hypothetical protein
MFVVSMSHDLFSQNIIKVTSKRIPVDPPLRITGKYVNFDVLKVMIGHGQSFSGDFKNGFACSWKFQLLSPVAALKNIFPIAYGVTFGISKIRFNHASLAFSKNELSAIIPDQNIRKTNLRTGYIGITLLKVLPWKVMHTTLMLGPSLQWNLSSHLRTRYNYDHQHSSIHSGRYIERFSMPFTFQASWSLQQLVSIGIFGCYDVNPRFKGDFGKPIKQAEYGISVALII